MRLRRRMLKDKAGTTSVEYALIAAIISLAAVAGYGTFANSVNAMYNSNTEKLETSWKD